MKTPIAIGIKLSTIIFFVPFRPRILLNVFECSNKPSSVAFSTIDDLNLTQEFITFFLLHSKINYSGGPTYELDNRMMYSLGYIIFHWIQSNWTRSLRDKGLERGVIRIKSLDAKDSNENYRYVLNFI